MVADLALPVGGIKKKPPAVQGKGLPPAVLGANKIRYGLKMLAKKAL